MKRRLMELAGIVHRSQSLKGKRLLKEEPEDDAGEDAGDDAGGDADGGDDSGADSLFGDDSSGDAGGLDDDSADSDAGDAAGDDEAKPKEPEDEEPKLSTGDIAKYGESDVEEPIYDAVESAFAKATKHAKVGEKYHRGKPGATYVEESLKRYSLKAFLFEEKKKEEEDPTRIDLANFDMQAYANEISHKIKYYTTQFDWQGMILNISKQFLLNNIHEKEAQQAVQEFEEILARVEDLDHLIDDYDDPVPVHTAVGAVAGGGGGV
jgi:hypothetical protein